MTSLLIIEDEALIRSSLARLLERNGYQVAQAGSVAEAKELGRWSDYDLIIADIRLPGEPGTTVIAHAAPVPVLLMTSYASVRSAVDAMKEGAADYIAKPFDHDEMVLTVERLLHQQKLARENARLRSELAQHYPVEGMIGDSPAMRSVFSQIRKVAPTATTVLVLGESGTGKELVARALHALSPRRDGPFIAVNCAAIPDTLLESELFGHEKGAFTGANERRIGLIEAASGGTLFLDEIGELPAEAQARLLRVLQEGEVRRLGENRTRRVDVRLVSATHRDLQQAVAAGGFRQDLYYRLAVMPIQLPPLRERHEDIEPLARRLLERSCRRLNRPALKLSPQALKALHNYDWPGNVRELENVIERAVILAEGDSIEAAELSLQRVQGEPAAEGLDIDLSLDDYFIEYVTSHQQQMTETELARHLGISRKTLWEKRRRLGIPRNK